MKKLLALLEPDQKEPTREAIRLLLTGVALHAIVGCDAYRGLSADEKGEGAVNLANAAMKALQK